MISQVVTLVLGFVLPRLFVVNYGSDVNGLLNSLAQIFVYMSLFEAGVGAVTVQALYKPIAHEQYSEVNGILSATNQYYKRTGCIYLICLVGISLFYPLLIHSDLDYITVSLVSLFYGLSNVILFFFQGKYKLLLETDGKGYVLSNLTTIITILTNIMKIVMITLNANIVIIIILTFIVNMIQAIYIMYYIKKKYKWIDLSVIPYFKAIKQKNAMLLHQFAGLIFQNTDVLLLTFFCDLKVVSVYSMYKLVVMHINSLLNTGLNSVLFALGQIYNTNLERFKKIIDIVELYYGAIAFALYTVALYLYIPFMKLYTAGISDINYIDYALPWLFVLAEVLVIIRTPMLKTITFAGHFKQTLPQTLIETAINFVFSIICVMRFGIKGVLMGTIFALLYRTNDILIYANKKILKRSPGRSYLVYFIDIIIMLCLYGLFRHYITYEILSYPQLALTGVFITVVSVVVFLFIQSAVFYKQTYTILVKVKQYAKKR